MACALEHYVDTVTSLTTQANRINQLRSTDDPTLLRIDYTHNVTMGDRAFSVYAPKVWNKIPRALREAPSLNIFKSKLKTYTFKIEFSGNYNELMKFISKNQEILNKNVTHLDTVLATLQPSIHTLGALAVLKVRLSNTSHTDANIDTIQATVAEFINVCDRQQIKHSPDLMAELCQSYTDLLIAGKCPMRGILILQTAIEKIRESPYHLTSVHAQLTHLCLASKCLKPALKFLDVDLMDISKENGFYDVKHYLLYCYYGAMIYLAVKNYDRAYYFLNTCLSTPALAVSHIMLEAYKKYILVSLILKGKMEKVPKYASLLVNRFIRPLSSAYTDLGLAIENNEQEEMNSLVVKHRDIYLRDDNLGLVNQVVNSTYKMKIQRLTKTFLTLSLVDVANRVNLDSPKHAEKYILNMIEDGEIHASINQKDGMVIFLDSSEKFNSPDMIEKIDQHIQLCISVEKQIKQMEEDILVNAQYVQKVLGSSHEDGPHVSQHSAASSSQITPASSSRP